MATAKEKHVEVAVIGAGIVGLTAAWGIAHLGKTCALIAPNCGEPDGKTSALMSETITFLQTLGLWEEAAGFAFPLKTMRIIDGTNRLIRAPQTDFHAKEIDKDAFGYNIENARLAGLIDSRLEEAGSLHRFGSQLSEITPADPSTGQGPYTLKTSSGEVLTAEIVIAADGRNSLVRNQLQIGEKTWQYPQVAMVGNFTHTLDHFDTSTEFHTETGPFTLVPLGEKRSSLVCVLDQGGAEHLSSLKSDALNLHLEMKMQSFLGKISMEAQLKQFPLGGMVANRFGTGSAVLAGEAAHVFPPIGAQGLNLGLRDVEAALGLVSSGNGSASIGERYHAMRARDIHTRTASVDILNRSLLSDLLPVQAGRSLGLYALGTLSPLRALMMREGIAPGTGFRNLFSGFSGKTGSSVQRSDHTV